MRVYALSTGTGKKKLRNRNGNVVNKPEFISEKNKHVNEVDLCETFLSSYPFNYKTLKWWKKRIFQTG